MGPERQPKRWMRRGCLYLLAVLSVVGFLGKLWYNYEFPYGQSHSCTKGLGLGLRLYAQDHNGWYPCGGKTPEESLSLVCSNNDPYLLQSLMRGKHLTGKVVDEAFVRDGVLSPASCGWHYVEGLRESDSPNLAVAWDKVTGLGHNGQRQNYEHEIVRLDGSTDFIPKGRWPSFCTTQKLLLAEAMVTRNSNDPPIRWSDENSLGPNKFPPAALSKAK